MINPIKRKLNEGEDSFGSWVTLAHTAICEIMAKSGFEWLAIDMEHSVIGIHEVESLIQVIEGSGSVPLVRLSDNDPILTKRVMDAGAYGVIVPMVNTPEQAEKAVQAVKYPTRGNRGVGLYRAQSYGPGFETYANSVNDESIVIIQIEHIEGVQNIDEILSIEGIDGLFIGPYDLSGSLGIPGQLNHPKVEEAKKRVLDVAKEKNVAAGIHVVYPVIDELKRSLEEGYRFVGFGTDFLFLGEFCRDSVEQIKKLLI